MQQRTIYLPLITCCLFLQGLSVLAIGTPEQQIDSLKTVIENSKEDTSKVNALSKLALLYMKLGFYEEGETIAKKVLELSEKLDYVVGRSYAFDELGTVQFNKADYKEARAYFFKALVNDKKSGDLIRICRQLRNIGLAYVLELDDEAAMKYYSMALQVADSSKNNHAIAATLNGLGFIHMKTCERTQGIQYYKKALAINKNPVNNVIRYVSLNMLAYLNTQEGEYILALDYNFKSLAIAKLLKDDRKMSLCFTTIGDVYQKLGDFSKALDYYFRALKIVEKVNDYASISDNLSGIGKVYLRQGDIEQAEEFLTRSYDVVKKINNEDGIAKTVGNLGLIYIQKNDTLKAIPYFLQAIELNEKSDYVIEQNLWLNCLGEIYATWLMQKRHADSSAIYYKTALNYYSRALKNAEDLKIRIEIIRSCYLLGAFHLQHKQLKQAEEYLKTGLQLSQEIGELNNRKDIYKSLSELYVLQNRFQEESAYYKKYITTRDSIFNKENTKKMLRSEINFEFEKKQSILKAEQDKKNALVKAETKRQRTIMWFIGILAGLIFIASVFIYRSYVHKQRINEELNIRSQRIETAHKIIKEKNHEITDSINYALHIQQAMLPDKNTISSILPQSFVIFKPKDIVSGDFYFFGIYHDKIFVATADCTGHGVPGGFMSMIGTEKLNNAVKLNDNPGKILSLLNSGIKASFSQNDGEKIRDGMDIAICSLDLKTNVLEFAGANRPLWIVRENGSSLEEIKGTKVSIGGLTDDQQKFETNRIQLEAGDTFYICSDGYADQFGSNDKKLTSRRLKNMLEEIKTLSIVEQDHYLSDFIVKWKGDMEQTDDILIVGVRI